MKSFVTDCDCYLGDLVPLEVHVPTEAEIFGKQSHVVAESTSVPQPIRLNSWVESYSYECCIILIFILFSYLFFNFSGDIRQLFHFLTRRTSPEQIYAEQKSFFKRFINLSTLLGVLLIGMLGIKLADFLSWGLHLFPAPPISPEWFPLIGVTSVSIVLLYRYLVIHILAALTANQLFFQSYRFMSHLSGSISFLILTPFFLLFALGVGEDDTILLYFTLGLATILYIAYLTMSCRFFLEQKVSILQWIMYLCAVEWFPISFLMLEASKFV